MKSNNEPLRIGDWLVEPRLNLISQDDRHISLRPQAMDLLVYLAHRHGQVVSADKLIDEVWHGVTVTSGSVYNCINELRQAFGDDPHNPDYFETITKRGYRLIAPVEFAEEAETHSQIGDGQNRSPFGGVKTLLPAGRLAKVIMSGLVFAVLGLVIYMMVQAPEPPIILEPEISPRSIAVLPFKDLSPEGDQEYFADGITEELLNTLAGVEGIKVAARSSSFYFKDTDISVQEIAQVLGVFYIIEGSVRRTENRVRITAQLIDASNGFHLWSQTFDRELGDIFLIQDEISAAIVAALRDQLDLSRDEIGEPRTARVVSPEAYSEYLLGRHLMNQRTKDAFEAALQHFKNAIEADESYAPAYANMALTYGLMVSYGGLHRDEAYVLAKPYADRAMDLDPNLAATHAAMSYMEVLQNILDPDFKYLNRAIALNPSYVDALNWKVGALIQFHREEEAFALRESALKIDPLSFIHNLNTAYALLDRDRRDEAKAVADRMKTIEFGWGQRLTGDIAYAGGDIPGAIEPYLIGLESRPQHEPLTFQLARVLSEVGLGAEAGRLYPDLRIQYYVYRNEGNLEGMLKAASVSPRNDQDAHYLTAFLPEAFYFNRNFASAASYCNQVLPASLTPGYVTAVLKEPLYIFCAFTFRAIGNEQRADAVFEAVLNRVRGQEKGGYADGRFYQLKALILLYQGRIDEALDAFERAFEAGNRNGWEFSGPLLDAVRDHPRFLALLGKYQTAKTENRAQVLALICSDDLPEFGWRPLPETCESIKKAAK